MLKLVSCVNNLYIGLLHQFGHTQIGIGLDPRHGLPEFIEITQEVANHPEIQLLVRNGLVKIEDTSVVEESTEGEKIETQEPSNEVVATAAAEEPVAIEPAEVETPSLVDSIVEEVLTEDSSLIQSLNRINDMKAQEAKAEVELMEDLSLLSLIEKQGKYSSVQTAAGNRLKTLRN